MGVNCNDYRAAVERLRRVESGESVHEVYAIRDNGYAAWRLDKALIYDAEHDQTPLAVELIQAEMGQDCKKYRYGVRDYWFTGERMFSFADSRIFVHGVMICSNATLGDLRKLLQLIAKKEGA